MATFRKRGDLQWQASVRIKGYPPQHKTFESKDEAIAWAGDTESKMKRRVWHADSEATKTTLKECIERYVKEVSPKHKGYQQEISRLNVLKRSPLSAYYMSNIRSKDVADYRNARLGEVSINTVKNELSVLSAVFQVARYEWGMETLDNPVRGVPRPPSPEGRKRRLEGDEEARLLEAASRSRSPWIRAAIILAIETAMRAGEICKLRWSDIDLEGREIHLVDTKNGTSRDVPIFPAAYDLLKDLPRRIDGKVFVYKNSQSLGQAFSRICEKTKDAAGKPQPIVDLHFHDLRHEATSRLAPHFQLQELAKITGHKDPKMLLRYYHPKAGDLAKRVAGKTQ